MSHVAIIPRVYLGRFKRNRAIISDNRRPRAPDRALPVRLEGKPRARLAEKASVDGRAVRFPPRLLFLVFPRVSNFPQQPFLSNAVAPLSPGAATRVSFHSQDPPVFSFAGKLDYYARSSYLRGARPLASTAYFLAHPLFGRSFALFSASALPPCAFASPPPFLLLLFLFLTYYLLLLLLLSRSRISKCCAVVKTTNSDGKPLVTGRLPLPRATSLILTEDTSRPQKKTSRALAKTRARVQ